MEVSKAAEPADITWRASEERMRLEKTGLFLTKLIFFAFYGNKFVIFVKNEKKIGGVMVKV